MGIPKGITVSQETLHEIMGIMTTVPDETITGNHGVPPSNCYPSGNIRTSLSFTESEQM